MLPVWLRYAVQRSVHAGMHSSSHMQTRTGPALVATAHASSAAQRVPALAAPQLLWLCCHAVLSVQAHRHRLSAELLSYAGLEESSQPQRVCPGPAERACAACWVGRRGGRSARRVRCGSGADCQSGYPATLPRWQAAQPPPCACRVCAAPDGPGLYGWPRDQLHCRAEHQETGLGWMLSACVPRRQRVVGATALFLWKPAAAAARTANPVQAQATMSTPT